MKHLKISNIFSRSVFTFLLLNLWTILFTNLFLDASLNYKTLYFTYSNNFFSLNTLLTIILFLCIALYGNVFFKFSKPKVHFLLTFLVNLLSIFIWCMTQPAKPYDSYDIYFCANQWSIYGPPIWWIHGLLSISIWLGSTSSFSNFYF